MTGLTRRGVVTAAPATVVAFAAPVSAARRDDDELLSLRSAWVARRAAFEDALKALSLAETRFAERAPSLPDYHGFTGTMDEYCTEHRRVTAIRDGLEAETGLTAARAAEDHTSDADSAMVDQIFALPARTKEGIRFKREVLADWDGCARGDLTESLLSDLLAIGGFDE